MLWLIPMKPPPKSSMVKGRRRTYRSRPGTPFKPGKDSKSYNVQTTERYIAKRQMLMTRKDECNRNIRDLGILPEEAFEKYINEKLQKVSTLDTMQESACENISCFQLMKKLHTVNEGLKKFAHVNKKAFEQYTFHEAMR